ncbi:hypothetical protein AOCH_007374 [Aspergillus ochraceoroseus]|uniref:Uncharacterized protein n=1 Tax=Aspergillus ochraceoroseus TaxID=138278 RepID=A0A0F8XMT9_9EURO|nr:hypothetical protein AOCH_007374 [Aspergillus ochraceoroseus]
MARTFTTQGEVNSPKIQKYFQQVAQFKEKLAVAGPDVGSSQDWTSERFHEVLKWESQTSMGAFPNNMQVEWEQEMATMEADEDPDEIRNIADEQAGHTPHVAGMG